ncbi:hypothetical protein GCM10009654_25140 [Streptomyces hebeiensis]|uniref:CobW C-terminal domain-containing protein n=1 Tax=Streptomyces hebeiensis TaxID=229486 RepID=A0ABN1UV66_9ACTN
MVPPVRRAAAALDWHPKHGDRCQHLVFTSPGLDRDGLARVLDYCLLTDAEYTEGPRSMEATAGRLRFSARSRRVTPPHPPTAIGEMSTAVTRRPRVASHRVSPPVPHARSSAVPGGSPPSTSVSTGFTRVPQGASSSARSR